MAEITSLSTISNRILPFNVDFSQFKKSQDSKEKIYLDLNFKKELCERYNLKYFKLISFNLTENSIESNIFQNLINPDFNFSNSLLNNLQKFEIKNIRNNNDILLSDIAITSLSSKNRIETYTKRKVLSNSQIIDFSKYGLDFNEKLYFKVKNHDLNEKYNFMIYCYDNKNRIFDKMIIKDVNVSSIEREETEKNNIFFEELANNLYDLKLRKELFSFSVPEIELNLKTRKVSLGVGPSLLLYRDNIEKIINKVYIEEITNKGIASISNDIDLKKFNSSKEKVDVIFKTRLERNEIPKKYILYCVLITGKILTFEKTNFQIKKNTNESFIEKIKKDILGIDLNIQQEQKRLNIEIKINDNFSNSNIDSQYDPYISKIYIDNVDIDLNFFFLNNEKIQNQSFLKLNNIKNKKINLNISSRSNILNRLEFPVKIVFSNLNQGEIENISYEKEAKKNQNLSVARLTKILSNDNLSFLNQYTFEKYQYFFDISNVDIFSKSVVTGSSGKSIASRYSSLNLDKILSDDNKNVLLNDININNFYLIIKKNISFSNRSISSFEIFDVNETNNGIYDFSFFDDQNFRNFSDDPRKYDDLVLKKEIEFESKILSLPLEYFSKKLTEYQIKLKIKEILKANKDNDYIPLQSQINSVYDKLSILNNNGSGNLSQNDIQLLYDLFALKITYAKTEKTEIRKIENKASNITKIFAIDIVIPNHILQISKNVLTLYIDANHNASIDETECIKVFHEIFKNNFLGFSYQEENSTYPNIKLQELYSKNNIPNMFLPWSSNDSNNITKEINENCAIELIKKNNTLYQVVYKIDLNKCNNLYNFLTLLQNEKEKTANKNRIFNRLYQLLSFREITKNYIDNSGNNVNVIVTIKNKDQQYIKYPIIPVL